MDYLTIKMLSYIQTNEKFSLIDYVAEMKRSNVIKLNYWSEWWEQEQMIVCRVFAELKHKTTSVDKIS